MSQTYLCEYRRVYLVKSQDYPSADKKPDRLLLFIGLLSNSDKKGSELTVSSDSFDNHIKMIDSFQTMMPCLFLFFTITF